MRRRRRRVSRLELFYAAVIACVMVGGSLWLDRSGSLVSATVAGKRERIVVGYEPSGEWDRYHEVLAAFDRPDGVRSEAIVRVPQRRYDSLRGGDPIELRYLPQFPPLARTSDRSTATAVRDFASAFAAIPIVAWLAVGVVSLWIAARLGSIPVIAVGAAWAAAAWPVLFTAPSREGGRAAEAMAEVRLVTLVDRSPARLIQTRTRHGRFDTRLEVPYEVVELALAAGSGDTVVAVDAVDSGSVTGLVQGAHLAVRLDPAAPREAQLAGGTRRFAKANRYHFLIPVSGCAVLGTLAGLAYRWRRRKRQTTTQEETMARQGTAIAAGVLLLLLEAGSAAAQVSAGMRIPEQYAPRTTGVLRQLVCRGKAGLHVAKEHDPSPRDGRRVSMTLTYQRNPGPAGFSYENLEPGSCSWNPANVEGVPAEPGTVHFDLDRDGSEWVPDPGSLPPYLGDPQHFWVFYVDDLTHYSASHGAWRERFWLPDSLRQRTRTSDATALFRSAELRCRGGEALAFTRGAAAGDNQVLMMLTYPVSPNVAGETGRGLAPGSCAWADRTGLAREQGRVGFVTAGNAQLKQAQSGSTVDRSPTAAERWPDAHTIPIYMSDPGRYWRFTVVMVDADSARQHGPWKPSIVNAIAGPVSEATPTRTVTRTPVAVDGAVDSSRSSVAFDPFAVRGIVVTPSVNGVQMKFEGPSVIPLVQVSTSAPFQEPSTGRWIFAPGAIALSVVRDASGGTNAYSAATTTPIQRATEYHYLIGAPKPASTGTLNRRRREGGDRQAVGTFRTLRTNVTVRIGTVRIIDDSDDDSNGDLAFTFSVDGDREFEAGTGTANVSPGSVLDLADGATYDFSYDVNAGVVPEVLRLHMAGFDNDGAFPSGSYDRSWGATPGGDGGGDWNHARAEYNLDQYPGRSFDFPFRMRTGPGSTLQFEIEGRVSVTRE